MNTNTNQPVVIMPPSPVDRKTAVDLSGFIPGALLPAVQAAILAVSVFLTVSVYAWIKGALDPLLWGLGCSIWIIPAVIAGMIWRWAMLTWVSQQSQQFADDPEINAQPYTPEFTVNIISKAGREGVRLHLPGTPEQLTTLAQGLLSGEPFTERRWMGGKGKLYSPDTFQELRAELLGRRMITQQGATSQRGYKITPEGMAFFREWLKSPAPLEDESE
jgi:hypothetical protein